ncbi:hypothetical protein MKX03_037066 [Papaver bracteatum]|nr:hypothetical protein MKX03_037066 [Papaver bracteatum]
MENGDENAIETSCVADYLRANYKLDAKNKMLMFPLCMNSHWVLLVLHEGVWKICNFMKHSPLLSTQLHTLTKPLSKVLNEIGHRSKDGNEIVHTLKIPKVVQQQEHPDCAIFICFFMKMLVKYQLFGTLARGNKNQYIGHFNRKRIKMAFRILDATDEWKKTKISNSSQIVIYSPSK